MEKISTSIVVVALALQRPDGLWLMHRRPPGKHHAGLWEFPGGKMEEGELPENALEREIAEELGLALDPAHLAPVAFATSVPQGDRPGIVILLYRSVLARGEPEALEGGEIGWFTPEEVHALAKPPLDIALAGQLFGEAAG